MYLLFDPVHLMLSFKFFSQHLHIKLTSLLSIKIKLGPFKLWGFSSVVLHLIGGFLHSAALGLFLTIKKPRKIFRILAKCSDF
jgi:hypothetical protein